jgi:poly(beta-D-mannuronate) lyase
LNILVPLAATCVLLLAPPAVADTLRAPFDTREPSMAGAGRACVPPAAAVAIFAPASKYGQAGSARDAVDAEAEAGFEAAMRPIRSFAQGVVKQANAYQRSGARDAATCAADHLAVWARADALAAPGSHTAWYKLATTLSGLSLAYLQIRPALDPTRRQEIEPWLNRRGRDVAAYFAGLRTPRSSRNNHRAWAGLAAAAAGAATGDQVLLASGYDSYRIVACQATAAGALPLELERGRKAAEYHLYAMAALTVLSELGARNGTDLAGACDGALARIAAFTLRAVADPTEVAALAKTPQEPADRYMTPSKLVFAEPWLARNPAAVEAMRPLLARRPLTLTDLGGDQTLLYARPR